MLHRFDSFDYDWATRPGSRRFMAADAYRQGDTYFIEIDVPGVPEEAIDISVERKSLSVTVDRILHSDEERTTLIQGRPSGSFTRRFFLSDGLDPEGVEADLDRGVLRISIPVVETAKARKIAVGTIRNAIES